MSTNTMIFGIQNNKVVMVNRIESQKRETTSFSIKTYT